MGIFFSKNTNCDQNNRFNEPSTQKQEKEQDLTKIIKQYEYIKETKRITNINRILEIIRNTNWDENTEWIEKEYIVAPSAPVQENIYPKSIDILAKVELPIAVPIP